MANPLPLRSNNPYTSYGDSDTNQMSPFNDAAEIGRSTHHENPERPTTSSSSKKVHLQRLDGTPYEVPSKPTRVQVAQDMYDGIDPPEYKRLATPEPTNNASRARNCGSCGRHKAVGGDPTRHASHSGCNKCGKKKVANLNTANNPSPTTFGSISVESSTAVPRPGLQERTLSAPADRHPRVCNKCGKSKRPVTASAAIVAAPSVETEAGPASAPLPGKHIASQHILFSDLQPPPLSASRRGKPATLGLGVTGTNIDIDVTPPTATTEHPPPNVLSRPRADGSQPSPSTTNPNDSNPRRSVSLSSISSSISRSFSKRRTNGQSMNGIPSDQADGPGRLINMITNAIRGNEEQEYERLGQPPRRPDSPFSFVGTNAGDDAFEMTDLRSPETEARHSWEKVENSASLSGPFQDAPYDYHEPIARPDTTRVRAGGVEPIFSPTVQEQEQDVFLADPATRPGITRFKSLRQGVSRASSAASNVARSTSLRRLGSIKNAPQYWYRTDMAIEGATVETY